MPQAGDYLLAMETRQLRRLARDARLAQLPRGLLGADASPPVPHLHDPYALDPAYMLTCLKRIESAVARLSLIFPGARVSGSHL
jgi:protein-tyrosine phosphatase